MHQQAKHNHHAGICCSELSALVTSHLNVVSRAEKTACGLTSRYTDRDKTPRKERSFRGELRGLGISLLSEEIRQTELHASCRESRRLHRVVSLVPCHYQTLTITAIELNRCNSGLDVHPIAMALAHIDFTDAIPSAFPVTYLHCTCDVCS